MSDTLHSGGDIEQQKQQSSPQSPDIIEKQKKLEKLGISVDSEILERIEADVGAKTAFEQDLVVVENNPTDFFQNLEKNSLLCKHFLQSE